MRLNGKAALPDNGPIYVMPSSLGLAESILNCCLAVRHRWRSFDHQMGFDSSRAWRVPMHQMPKRATEERKEGNDFLFFLDG